MSLRASGQVDASKLVKEITTSSPKRASRYQTAFKQSQSFQQNQLPPEEALSMFVDAQLTRHQYNVIRRKDKLRIPSYKLTQKAKKECYPSEEHIFVTETSAEIKLQGLLDNTEQLVS
nr:unnamed protein product [Callosobruchus analis]